MARTFWVDTDMGSDDAVALIMAFVHPDVDVVGISAVAGNVPLTQAAKNARFIAELCGKATPVYPGAESPLVRELETATWFHGRDGLSGYGGEPTVGPQAEDAVAALLAASHNHPGLVVVALGPLTNIAAALELDPSLPSRVSRCVVMGGAACTYGNVTPAAEYNIWVDPEAARSVFLSGMPVEMVGWEFCQGEYALNRSEIDRIRETDTTISRFTLNSNTRAMDAYYEQTGERRLSFPDPVAMAVAIDSSIVTRSSRHLVEVETESALTRGMTVVDKLDAAADERNSRVWAEALNADSRISVTWDIHTEQWKEMLYHSLTG